MDIFKKKEAAFILNVILGFTIVTSVLSGAIVQEKCGDRIHTRPQGYIQSPEFPNAYPNNTSCQWTIKGGIGRQISIYFDIFDLDEIEDPNCQTFSSYEQSCCSAAWLKIGGIKDENPLILCGRNKTMKPYVSSEPLINIKFHSSTSVHKIRGFQLTYAIIHGSCNFNETVCPNQHGACVPKCDHIMHCSTGDDEIGCVEGCQNRIMCKSWNGCYSKEERCDGVAQCGDHSDEHNCTPDLCKSSRGGFLCHSRQCIRESWQCDQTNDCGDGSDELNLIAIGCTCKLYTLRYGEGSGGNGNTARPSLQLSPLEREILCREPPPPYSIAVSHPPGVGYFSTVPSNQPPNLVDPLCLTRLCRGSHHRRTRRLRRQRRHPPTALTQPCLMVMPPDPAVCNAEASVYLSNNENTVANSSTNMFPELVYLPPRVSIDNKVGSSPVALSSSVGEVPVPSQSNVPPNNFSLPYINENAMADEAVIPIVMRLDSQQDDDDDRPLLDDE
ncbi:hypothetical protein CHUAL_011725 [Chamberlinius hualienensis]